MNLIRAINPRNMMDLHLAIPLVVMGLNRLHHLANIMIDMTEKLSLLSVTSLLCHTLLGRGHLLGDLRLELVKTMTDQYPGRLYISLRS
jgi:hypothetical protein